MISLIQALKLTDIAVLVVLRDLSMIHLLSAVLLILVGCVAIFSGP